MVGVSLQLSAVAGLPVAGGTDPAGVGVLGDLTTDSETPTSQINKARPEAPLGPQGLLPNISVPNKSLSPLDGLSREGGSMV